MSDFEIVKLQPEAWKDYKELRIQALKAEPQAFSSSHEKEIAYSDEKWRHGLLDSGKGRSWILFARDSGGKLVGMIGGYRDEDDIKNHSAQIWGTYVDKKIQGKGVGKSLMVEITREFKRDPDIEVAIVEVNVGQMSAKKLYESLGFEVRANYPVQMGDGKEYQICKMEKCLK